MKAQATQPYPFAVLTADLTASDDGWYQLLPAGVFKSRDGRPTDTESGHWQLDATSAANMIAATKAISKKILLDYDHQTLRTEKNGQPAPASGWLNSATDLEWREGQGLYIRPDWTNKAKALIDAKEYAFLSAVFPYNKQGIPLYLRMAAITNDPGLVELEPVAALAANAYFPHKTEDSVLNDTLKKLLAKLGIVVDGELTDELATAALNAVIALKTSADKVSDLEAKVATLSAQDTGNSGDVDLSKYVSVEAYNGVVSELAVLKAGSDSNSLQAILATAREKGKIVEAEMDYLSQFGQQKGVAALSALLESRPVIAALGTQQTTQSTTETNQDEHPPSDEVLAILNATGLTHEQYLAAEKENN